MSCLLVAVCLKSVSSFVYFSCFSIVVYGCFVYFCLWLFISVVCGGLFQLLFVVVCLFQLLFVVCLFQLFVVVCLFQLFVVCLFQLFVVVCLF